MPSTSSRRAFLLLAWLAACGAASLAPAGTYVLPPGPVIFSPLQATRVGTSDNGTAIAVAGRNFFLPPFGLQTLNVTFQGPNNTTDFGGGGQNYFGVTGAATFLSGNYQFHPTLRSNGLTGDVLTTTASISSNATSGNPNPSFTLIGASVGPVFQASGTGVTSNDQPTSAPLAFASLVAPSTGTINFGTIDFITGPLTSTVTVQIDNASTDTPGSVPAIIGNQADLTILSAAITGPDAAWFTLDGVDLAALLAAALDPQSGLPLDITFAFVPNPTLGPKNALLTIVTDQFGGLGGANSTFQFNLVGIATPEPMSVAVWSLVGLVGLAYGLRRWRR